LNNQYGHQYVNHSVSFIATAEDGTKVHTNKVESYWNQAKSHLKEMRGIKRLYLQTYLDEFMWRKNNSLTETSAYEEILKLLARFYPLSEELINFLFKIKFILYNRN
jgi:transposase